MLENILVTLRWSFSIGNKFFRVVPRDTLLIVAATLVSQFSILLAFLLPLKILMLLGSTGVPRYFPAFFADYDRNVLVIALSLAAIGFYLLFFLAEKIIAYGSCHGADLLLKKNHKITLFENQEEIASRGYQRYARSLASSVFLFLVAVVIAFLYPELLLVLIAYVVLAFFVLAIFYSKGGRLKSGLDDAPGTIVNTATSIGFLLAFGMMVAQFLFGDPPGLLVAIISLILMRQGASRITGLVNDLKGLYGQRFRLNALFFHGHVLVNEPKKHEKNFWSLFQLSQREKWVVDVLENVTPQPIDKVIVKWHQLGLQDMAAFYVKAFGGDGGLCGEYFVKLFNSNRGSLAKHEATLLTGETPVPALTLLSVDVVEGLHCHVMEWCPAKKPSQKQALIAKSSILKELMAVEPERKLVSRFSRSRAPLWQRIDGTMLTRLETVATMVGEGHVQRVERFSVLCQDVLERLKKLPLSIVNPELGPDALLECKNKEVLSVHWGRWSLEPIGSGWPTQVSELEKLSVALDEAKNRREALRDVSSEDVHLAALVFSMERLYVRQQFVSALKLIPRILECIDADVTTPATTI